MQIYLWSYMALVNLVAFLACIYDKSAAIRGRKRIREKTLFAVSIMGGAAGMLAGMLLVRHKTRHWYFMLFVPLIVLIDVVIIITML